MHYAKAKMLFVDYTRLQSYNTLADIQLQNNGAQSSESTAYSLSQTLMF